MSAKHILVFILLGIKLLFFPYLFRIVKAELHPIVKEVKVTFSSSAQLSQKVGCTDAIRTRIWAMMFCC